MSQNRPPFRYDVVGSFLRTPAIKEARAKAADGTITAEELKSIEDREIIGLVEKEKKAGLKAVTDGEYRRMFWHMDFLWGLTGVERVSAQAFSVAFQSFQPKATTLKITGKLDFPEDHPFLSHFEYLNSVKGEGVIAKQCIPSPSMLHLINNVRDASYKPSEPYLDEAELLEDIAKTYQKAVLAFYDRGCRYLQLDDTSWGEFCSVDKRTLYAARGIDVDEVGKKYVEVLNKVLSVKPADMTITMHICRGNFRSTWSHEGSYEPVAPILFANCNVDGFFLEFDTERAGSFEPLRFIKDQKVVLGLVTSKSGELEDRGAVIARIHEAEKYLPLDQLRISPQCGFASTEEGNILLDEDQWKKIALIKGIAEEVWG